VNFLLQLPRWNGRWMPLLGPGNYLTHFLLQDKQRFGELCRENFLLLFTPHNLTPFSWKNDIKMSSFSMAQDA